MAEDLGVSRLRLTTDESDLDAGLDRAETRTRGFLDRVQGSMKSILGKSIAAFVATGFAAATAQGVKLNEVLNEVQSETEATGDEWAAMEATIRRENGRTTESVDDIGDAVKSMRQDLGLTGAEIDKYADRIFDAGLATHMGATAITKATDDIGDAYELDIDRALGSIDQLIAGQERWGGDLQARIAALPGLAKGIKGLGGTVDDAIALLNVASARGLDYAEVQKAVNAAVGKFKVPPDLKDIIGLQDLHKSKTQLAREEVEKIEAALKDFVAPDELRQLISQLDGIEDPTLRAAAAEKIYNDQVAALKTDPIARYLDILGEIPDAQARTQRAIELFGPKAGPIWAELAAKIHEAGGSLSSFSVSQDEAGHKAQELARNLDRGPIRSIKLLFESLGAGLADLGSNPLVTGVASLGTILGGFAPNLSGKIAGGLIGVVKSAWGKVASSAVVTSVVAFAADKAATAYLKALFAQDAIGAIVGRAWAATGGKLVTAAGVQGSLAGRAFAIAAAAAIVAAPIAILYVAIQVADDVRKSKGTFADQIDRVVEEGSLEALQTAKAAIEKQIDSQKIFGVIPYEFAGEVDAMKEQLDRINAAIAAKLATGGAAAIEANGGAITAAATKVTENAGDAMVAAWKASQAKVDRSIGPALRGPITAAGAAAAVEARRQGNLAAAAVAQGIRDKRDAVDQAWMALIDGIKNAVSPMKERAKLLGYLASKELVKGLHSNDPAVREQARATKQLIIDRLEELKANAHNIGKDGMESLRKAMKSKDPDIRRAAQAIYHTIQSHLPDKADGRRWGSAIGQGIYNGLKAWGAAIGAVVGSIANMMADFWRTGSPSKRGPLSTLGGPEGWGRRIGFGLAGGIGQTIGAVQGALAGAVAVPRFPALTPRLAMPAGPGYGRQDTFGGPSRDGFGGPSRPALSSSKTYIQNVKVEGTPKARDPLGIARQLTRFARTGELEKAWERDSD